MKNDYIYLQEVNSTSTYLKGLSVSETDLQEGTVVYTDFQTSGKGQQGNSWESEKRKNILFSILLYPKHVKPSEPFILSQLIAVAIRRTLNKYVGNISIKWPNDIYWNDKKICGTLLENSFVGNSVSQSVIGIGININQESFVGSAPNPVSLKQVTGIEFDIMKILHEVVDNIAKLYEQSKSNSQPIVDEYKQHLYRGKGTFPFCDKDGSFMAQIEDIEPSGMLVLKTDKNNIHRYAFKEVKYL
ncbi:biotin--[acetyl-CoA-carboxylase] ligase [Dysgonomonas sp. 216]|uniref:biotin--[acetyl-CoA-carboxylase] ligase n=1 Tax=Dysgonomonas sp. 216 TaxID=2302934 RepID=UPI0013D85CE5|nr:biotin--[acetyl-CoA-carboxylase] ligase [Dysgonomonas sp. 216]NDW18334.1 biotin--[acetyl-CoA-carboxylase] ligase [Dysgonomonas sp. 216]NDW18702.1 biotin--[acetyl-CoA-carboxylase] ligase [Dysgonomonas sp. 216]